jgi:hypothetical protein
LCPSLSPNPECFGHFARERYLRAAVLSGYSVDPVKLERVRTLLSQSGFTKRDELERLTSPDGLERGQAVLTHKCVTCHDLRTVARLFMQVSVWGWSGPSLTRSSTSVWSSSLNMTGASGNDTFNVNYSPNPGAVTISDSAVGNNVVDINDQASKDVPGSVTYSATNAAKGGILTRLYLSCCGVPFF